jgi:SAM-dependent methyltransferase
MGPQFFIENFVRFFDYVRIVGGLHVPGGAAKQLRVIQGDTVLATAPVNLPSPGLDVHCGFSVTFLAAEFDPKNVRLLFDLDDGKVFEISGTEAAHRYLRSEADANRCEAQFFDKLRKPGFDRVLEIGSRARSEISRRNLFEGKQYTGLDIVQGPNVDIVGDAHNLSSHFPAESFDAMFSVSTFEHLAMPWRVALEIHKVLRPGGLAYFVTHQALGMHELPWDFWRYSDTSWNSLFNSYTGFRVLETFLGSPMMLVPFIYHDHWKGYEGAVGFSTSSVLVEKCGPNNMEWNMDVSEVTKGLYPA